MARKRSTSADVAGEIQATMISAATIGSAEGATGKAEVKGEATHLTTTTTMIQRASDKEPDSSEVEVEGEVQLTSIKLVISTMTTAKASVSQWSSR